MTDWASIVTSVGEVAVNILPFILLAPSDGNEGYQLGDVQWKIVSNTAYAANTSAGSDVGLSYSFSTMQNNSSISRSVYQSLPANKHYDATQDLSDFKDGHVCIAPTLAPASMALAGLERAISFAIKNLSLATAVNVVGTIMVSCGKDTASGNYFLKLTNDSPIINWRATAKVTDERGNSVNVNAEMKKATLASDSNVWSIDLPSGVNLDPAIAELSLDLYMDQESFNRVTQDRRKFLRQGRPS